MSFFTLNDPPLLMYFKIDCPCFSVRPRFIQSLIVFVLGLKENNLINTEDKTIILTPELQNLFKINYNEPQPVNKLVHLVTRVYRLEKIENNVNNPPYSHIAKNKITPNNQIYNQIEYVKDEDDEDDEDDIDLNF